MRRRHAIYVCVASLWLAGCAGDPSRKIYLLGDRAGPSPQARTETGLPVIELARVSVPDYLDSTDIVLRNGANEVVVSSTGRWGERLSFAIADAVIPTLSRLMPQAVVTASSASPPAKRLFIQIERFDLAADGRCVIAARWRLASGDGRATAASAFATFERTAASSGDQAMAETMTALLDQLAAQIVLTTASP
jgi:uncharacterized lipoprotein YmbA